MASSIRTGQRHFFLASRSRQSFGCRGIASAASAPAPAVEEYPQHGFPGRTIPNRRSTIKDAKPFSSFLTDNYARQHNYLRISLTEKCNLRCLYCMPEEGVPQSPPQELLTSPEIYLLSSVFVREGVTKIRLTGGEPTIRKDILPLMQQIGSLRSYGLKELCITTNGISLHRKLDSMAEAGLTGVNLSLDTLDPWQFQIMTRRKGFEAVMKSIDRILEMNRLGAGIKLKINCVVMRGMNEREILPFVELGREQDLEVRFIEYMPFDGNKWSKGKMLGYKEMLEMIRIKYPSLRKVQDHKNDTSKTYEIPGFVGRMGFITSMTHNFCGSCNRLRITNDGNLKVCLFGNAEVSLRDIIRKTNGGDPIDEQAYEAMKQIEMDRQQGLVSSESPLGRSQHEKELLDVIGMAVSHKKEKHAGMGELENMKNRPMILIDNQASKLHLNSFLVPHRSRQATQPWRSVGAHLLSSPYVSSHVRLFATKSSSDDDEASYLDGTGFFSEPLLDENDASYLDATESSQTLMRYCLGDGKLPHKHTTTGTRETGGNDGEGKLSIKGTSPFLSPKCSSLTHLNASGDAHMVSISSKVSTSRQAVAVCSVYFSNPTALPLIRSNSMKKGDVLSVARVAGIMAAKRTSDLIPLCHPIAITHVSVDLQVVGGSKYDGDNQRSVQDHDKNGDYCRVEISATVTCDGKTGVEMEALTAASTAALTMYDMCKAVDKGMRIMDLRVIRKEGGKSGTWIEGGNVP